jgi:hypothetical protein
MFTNFYRIIMIRFVILAASCFATALSFTSIIPQKWSRPNRSQQLITISAGSSSSDPAAALTNTLARLDQQWKIQQQSQPRSRWTKVILPNDGDDKKSFEESVFTPVTFGQEYCYLLEPPNNSVPSCIILFTGGAGLGTYPQIAYNEFLLRLSNQLNAAVLTAPYQVGLDHFALGTSMEKSVLFSI